MGRLLLFIITLCLLRPLSVDAQSNLQAEGIAAYEAQELDQAIKAFTNAEKEGNTSVELYYNLGTAYLAKNDLGNARLYLERAALHDPNNDAILNNLNIVKDKLKTTIIPLESFFLKQWWQACSQLMSPKSWAMVSLLFLFAALFFVYHLWFKSRKFNNAYFITAFLTMGVLCVLLGYTRYSDMFAHDVAIVMQPTQMLNSASKNSELIQNLSEGVKLQVVEQFNEWSKIQTLALEEGWVLTADIKEL